MTRSSEDDRAAVDRAFAEMMAGYHLTAERPAAEGAAEVSGLRPAREPDSLGEPDASSPTEAASPEPRAPDPRGPDPRGPDPRGPDPHWADLHPLFHLPPPPTPVEAVEPVEHYVPEVMPPLRPAGPVLLGWLGIGWAALVVLAGAFGAQFPSWVAWVAVVGFLGGFAVLISRLPRHRPPDAGDGAVL